MVDKKYLREIIKETMKSMSWAKESRKHAKSQEDKDKYLRYYKQSRVELAGLYLVDGRAIITTGYEEYIPLIKSLYKEYGMLIQTNLKLRNNGIYPELVTVRIRKYKYIRKGLKMLHEEITRED